MPDGYHVLTRRPQALYFHGGVAGLVVGSFLLPACEVEGVEDDDWYLPLSHPFCFVTTDLLQAFHSALNCERERGSGTVYRVEPIGHLWLDEDDFGFNYACRQARILAAMHVPSWAREAFKTDAHSWSEEWVQFSQPTAIEEDAVRRARKKLVARQR